MKAKIQKNKLYSKKFFFYSRSLSKYFYNKQQPQAVFQNRSNIFLSKFRSVCLYSGRIRSVFVSHKVSRHFLRFFLASMVEFGRHGSFKNYCFLHIGSNPIRSIKKNINGLSANFSERY